MTTNSGGWDAVCAINAANLNQLFLHWYLANHPTTARMRIQAWQPINDPNALILDAELGPPEITFLVDGPAQQAQISMVVTGGTLVFFDMYSGGVSSMQQLHQLQPDTARVTGTVDLAKVEGSLALGEVQLQLGSGTYQPAVSGLDPNSDAASALGSAIDDSRAVGGDVARLAGLGRYVTTTDDGLCATFTPVADQSFAWVVAYSVASDRLVGVGHARITTS